MKARRNKRDGRKRLTCSMFYLYASFLSPKKVVTTPAILKTLPVIKSKNDKPSEQPVEVLPSNVLSSDYVEEIEMTYDEPAEPKTKNIKLKNLRANGKVDERPCPKV